MLKARKSTGVTDSERFTAFSGMACSATNSLLAATRSSASLRWESVSSYA
jgi:hypothetical protein